MATRPSLNYCGDDTEAKEVAAALIRDVGFGPLDAGPLRVARLSRARKARERKVSLHKAEDDQTDYLRWFAGRIGEFFAFFLK